MLRQRLTELALLAAVCVAILALFGPRPASIGHFTIQGLFLVSLGSSIVFLRPRRRDPQFVRPTNTVRLSGEAPIFILSDLHMGSRDGSDLFRGKDRKLVAFLRRISRTGKALILNGDTFDLDACEDPFRIVAAHRRVFRMLRKIARRMPLYILPGNHDPILPAALIPGAILCRRIEMDGGVIIEHGDQFDPVLSDAGPVDRFGVKVHKLLQKITSMPIEFPLSHFNNPVNRFAYWGFYQYMRFVDWLRDVHRSRGNEEEASRLAEWLDYWGRNYWGDFCGLFEPVSKYLVGREGRTIVLGHSHLPGIVTLHGGTYVNSGSWVGPASSYAMFDGRRFSVHDWGTGKAYGEELYRRLMDEGTGSIFDWWERNYLGYLDFIVDESNPIGRMTDEEDELWKPDSDAHKLVA